MNEIYKKFESKIASLKFAVFIIALFGVVMIVGTFVESYSGADFANRTVYKTPLFIGIQFFMFLSITFALLRRLPPKKRLYGFYTIHTGLILVACGSVVTYIAGIDGSILLPPNVPSRSIVLNDDVFKIRFEDEGRLATKKLPFTGFAKKLGDKYENFELIQYLPYADMIFKWSEPTIRAASDLVHSSKYFLSNSNVSQAFTLSLHPESLHFESTLKMGLLNIVYLPEKLATCFAKVSKSKIIIWDTSTRNCQTPEDLKLDIEKTEEGKRFFVYKKSNKLFSFFPDFSPWPVDKDFKFLKNSSIRVFSQKLFEEKPHLFLFGKHAAYYDKDDEKWIYQKLEKNQPVDLPWMGFELILTDHSDSKVPNLIPEYVTPIQDNNELIKGGTKAVQVQVENRKYWVTNKNPLQLRINQKKIILSLEKESVRLPFELALTNFKMDKDPGTNSPASYESFVRLFSNEGSDDYHVFMNNPMKYDSFTFYQASYSQDQAGNYSSTLSANVDPGRPIKYLGSLLLVLGALWHYNLNLKKKSVKKDILT